MSDPTQYPMPVGTPVYATTPPPVPRPPTPAPGGGYDGSGINPGGVFTGGHLPGDIPHTMPGPLGGGGMGGGAGLPGGFERGSWFARFLTRHPQFPERHPDFLTNHPRIAANYTAYQTAHPAGSTPAPTPGAPTPPVPAPAAGGTTPAVPGGAIVPMPTNPQANTVGGIAQPPGRLPSSVKPVMDSEPKPMAGPMGTGVQTPTQLPGLTSGAQAIMAARTRPQKLPLK